VGSGNAYSPKSFLASLTNERDGSDGPWASYLLNAGGDGEGKGQNLVVVPSFSLSITLLPLASPHCNGTDTGSNYTCDSRHMYRPIGNEYTQTFGNNSNSTALGLSRFLATDMEVTQSAWYGTSNIGLGAASKQSITLANQLIAGTTSNVFNLGLFGLSIKALDIGGSIRPTFLEKLATVSSIMPGTGFSYTAGSFGNDVVWNLPSPSGFSATPSVLQNSSVRKAIPPSLVLGGYDASRVDQMSSLHVDIANNNALSGTYPLFVNLTSITFSNSSSEWHNGTSDSLGSVAVYIEPSVTQLWLPLSVCKVFEEVFGLTWNETSQLYLINATEHARLQRLNTAVTFTLHSSWRGGTVRDFTLSYASFDLMIAYPLVETTSYYFPLKRASSQDQYILGRTFLQETHISVDYIAGHFNISKPVSNDAPQALVSFPNTTSTTSKDDTDTGLSTRAYAGLGVGIGFLAILAEALLLLAWKKQWWPFKKKANDKNAADGQGQFDKGELHGEAIPRVEAMTKERMELEAKVPILEIEDPANLPHEVEGIGLVHELDAENMPQELHGEGPIGES
jgi:hypothetical protein